MPQAAPGGLPREHGEVEVVAGQVLGDVRAERAVRPGGSPGGGVRRPGGGADALRHALSGVAVGGMSTSSGPVKQAKAGIPSSLNSSRWSSPITIAMSGRALASAVDSDSMASWQRRYLRSQTSGASCLSSAGSALGEELVVGVVPGILAEELGISPVAFGVVGPHVHPGAELGRVRRGNADHDICHS